MLGLVVYVLVYCSIGVNEIVVIYCFVLIEIIGRMQFLIYLMVWFGLDMICLDYQMGQIVVQFYVLGIGGCIFMGVGVFGVCIFGMMDLCSCSCSLDLFEDWLVDWNLICLQIEFEIVEFQCYGFLCGIWCSVGIESLMLVVLIFSDYLCGIEILILLFVLLNVLDVVVEQNVVYVMCDVIVMVGYYVNVIICYVDIVVK